MSLVFTSQALIVLLAFGFQLMASGEAQKLINGTGNPRFPAFFAFGDSIIETGNNNYLPTAVKCNFPPYGKDFIDHKPTGRFSNGKVPVDFLASGLGIKELLPPYLSKELSNEDLLTGVNFASGLSGYDRINCEIPGAYCLTTQAQLKLFKDYQAKLDAITDKERAAMIISESLYLICFGSNDFDNQYFSATGIRKAQYDLPEYISFLLQLVSTFIEDLYNLGAKNMIVTSIPPLACAPQQRTNAGGPQRDCYPPYNQAVEMFNSQLLVQLNMLQNKFPGTKIVYIDIFEKLLRLIQYPSTYGFEVVSKGCCATGEYETGPLCNSITSTTCDDDSKYLFWDSYHPTEKAYGILSTEILEDINSAFSI